MGSDIRIATRAGWLAAIVLAAGPSAAARATVNFLPRAATRAEQTTAVRIARDYWRTNAPAGLAHDGLPSCGVPRITWARFAAGDSNAAESHLDGSCRIVFNLADWYWPLASRRANVVSGSDTWPSFCTAMAHEWGHLILGPTYFAAGNPSDPGHSADPRNLMYAFQVHFLPQCVRTPAPGPASGPVKGTRSP